MSRHARCNDCVAANGALKLGRARLRHGLAVDPGSPTSRDGAPRAGELRFASESPSCRVCCRCRQAPEATVFAVSAGEAAFHAMEVRHARLENTAWAEQYPGSCEVLR